jgi:hypothetical protein
MISCSCALRACFVGHSYYLPGCCRLPRSDHCLIRLIDVLCCRLPILSCGISGLSPSACIRTRFETFTIVSKGNFRVCTYLSNTVQSQHYVCNQTAHAPQDQMNQPAARLDALPSEDVKRSSPKQAAEEGGVLAWSPWMTGCTCCFVKTSTRAPGAFRESGSKSIPISTGKPGAELQSRCTRTRSRLPP